MDIWWKMAGNVRIRLTGADPVRSLRRLSRRYRLEDVCWLSDLAVEFTAARWAQKEILEELEQFGDRGEVLNIRGIPKLAGKIMRKPVLVCALLLILACTMWVPSRILFIQVDGNQSVPTRLILETASQCGVAFGAERRTLRSEEAKNRILEEIPELSWVGVNTKGCVAVISVQERSQEPEASDTGYGSIISVQDAVVTEITVTSGRPMCTIGQAVQAGQVLVSGYSDLGICTQVVAASGEVYGQTQRKAEAVLPIDTLLRTGEIDLTCRYSIIFGKNRINLYSDSGILDTTCGKMRMVYQLCLPGGWQLPVYLVKESYETADLSVVLREESDAESALSSRTKDFIREQMIAGQILKEDWSVETEDGVWRLTGLYQCREQIGRRSSGVYIEGD